MMARHALALFVFVFVLVASAGHWAAAEDPTLEMRARMVVPAGNMTVDREGRIFLSLHQFFEPRSCAVELREDGTLQPIPSRGTTPDGTDVALDAVLGIQAARDGTIWLLDNGLRGGATPKLVGWNAAAGRFERVIPLPEPATLQGSFLNDLAIEADGRTAYIADPAKGNKAALLVVDLAKGEARRVLQGHVSVVAEDVGLTIDGEPVLLRNDDGETVAPKIGVNPIALDAGDEWLYFGPMHGRALYRAPAAKLRDAALPASDLESAVEKYADKPVSDGIAIDAKGRIYVTDLAANAVGVIGPDRGYRVLVSDPRLSWPDDFAFDPAGRLLVVCNQLHRSPPFQAGQNKAILPFPIFHLPLPE